MRSEVLRRLVEVSAAEQLAVLEATLPHADGEDAAFLVALACQLASEMDTQDWGARLRRVWAQVTLGPDVATIRRGAIVLIVEWGWKGEPALWPALAEVCARAWREDEGVRAKPECTEGMLRLAEISGEGALARMLAEVVIGGETGQASRGAKVLKDMGAKCGANVEKGREVRNALALVCEKFDEHRIGAVLVGAAHALSMEVRAEGRSHQEPLAKWFGAMARRPHPAFLAMLRSKNDVVVKQRCWEWMRFGPLAEACAAGLDSGLGEGLEVGSDGVGEPRAWSAHPVRRGAGAMDSERLLAALNAGGDKAWWAAKLADGDDVDAAMVLVQSEDPRVRLHLATEGAYVEALDVALTARGPIGALATERLCGMDVEPKVWEKLARVSGLDRAAMVQLAWRGEWGSILQAVKQDAGLRVPLRLGVQMSLREHPEKEMEIAEVIRSGEEIEVEVLADACRGGMRFSLIEDAVLQRLERELEREVEAGRMCRLLSILVHRCVAKISDDVGNAARVESALARAAEHGDARVRSNALEAIGKWERAHPGRLAVLCRDAVRDEEGRPRATALRELARFAGNQQAAADVAENVMTMLGDAAAGHRLSATWASERVLVTLGPDLAGERWGELCDRLVEVADRDADLAVRARANAAARRLMAEIRVRSRRGDGVARVVGVGG